MNGSKNTATKRKPIKRSQAIQPLSHEHHHSLLLCWKIRTGIRKNIELDRIKKYANWFFEKHISPHFEIEEKYIYPVLGNENELVKKALAEHRRLTMLFENDEELEKSLSRIEEELEAHIRFEERILFNEVQNIASEEQLNKIAGQLAKQNFRKIQKTNFGINR